MAVRRGGLKVRLHEKARTDLKSIHDYLVAQADAGAADRVRLHLRQKIMRLAAHPLIGTPTTIADVRILPPTRYPYRVYYALVGEDVVILHIRHSARKLPEPNDLA